jgi:hypothetical protein
MIPEAVPQPPALPAPPPVRECRTPEALHRDAKELAALALRLRDLATRLRRSGASPAWLDPVLSNQVVRCAHAAEHLDDAARLLSLHR